MRPSIKRRDFLLTLSSFTAYNAIACPLITTNDLPTKDKQFNLRLRPHHINDVLDSRIFDLFEIESDCIMTTRAYLGLVNEKTPGIERICTHPKEDPEARLEGLTAGLVKLGIRQAG